uniref:A-kinase anchor protein 2 C-terminal domain-containing protein n=1 Tax=Strix occidentalis caurina TaxID=311401 RepID=A0A8D0EMM7_STROC
MDRVTRHLVFQLPQTSHKHDYNDAPQAGAWAEQRADSDDDVFGPAQHSSQRVENGYGWKTRSKSPSYFLDGGRDVWTPSPDRESKLEVVRSGSLYDLRAYRGERKPSKLYDEDEQEQCRVPPPNISPEKAKELEDERKEVIRNQVMRKSSTMAESSFAMSTPVDPENIDTEQINFSAARQQFLMLEKTNPGSFFSPGLQAMSPKPESMTKVSRQEWPSPEKAAKAPVWATAGSNGLDKETKISNETPIEREIRMAMEREENLWKERGIQRLTSSSELVEIKTKPLLSMDASPSPGRKGKDKGHASRYVQREIEQETKREEDLKKQGRLLGMYDRGTQQELDERRRVFEQEEAPPQKPTPPRKADERRSWVNEFVAEQPMTHGPWPAEDTRGGRSLPSCATSTTRFQAAQPPCAASEKSQDQPLVSRHVSASASKWGSEDSWGGRLPSSTPSPAGTAVLPRRYFSFSFWKPKVSFVEDMGTQNPLRREDGREEQYRLRTWKPQTSALIDKEIQSDLQREEELQEQRRRRQLIDGYSLVSGDGVPQDGSRSRHSSAASGVSGSYSVSGSPVSTPAPHQVGVLGLVSSFTPLRVAGPPQGSTETLGPDSARSSPFEERRRRVKEDGKVNAPAPRAGGWSPGGGWWLRGRRRPCPAPARRWGSSHGGRRGGGGTGTGLCQPPGQRPVLRGA